MNKNNLHKLNSNVSKLHALLEEMANQGAFVESELNERMAKDGDDELASDNFSSINEFMQAIETMQETLNNMPSVIEDCINAK